MCFLLWVTISHFLSPCSSLMSLLSASTSPPSGILCPRLPWLFPSFCRSLCSWNPPCSQTLPLPSRKHVDTSFSTNCSSSSFLTSQTTWLHPAEPEERMSTAQAGRGALTAGSLKVVRLGSRNFINCFKLQFHHLWHGHRKYLTGKFWRWSEIMHRKRPVSCYWFSIH